MRGARAMATWEVELKKRWRAGPGTFELDVAFRCEAERVVPRFELQSAQAR